MGVDTSYTPDDNQMVVGGVTGINVDVDCNSATNLENEDKFLEVQ